MGHLTTKKEPRTAPDKSQGRFQGATVEKRVGAPAITTDFTMRAGPTSPGDSNRGTVFKMLTVDTRNR